MKFMIELLMHISELQVETDMNTFVILEGKELWRWFFDPLSTTFFIFTVYMLIADIYAMRHW